MVIRNCTYFLLALFNVQGKHKIQLGKGLKIVYNIKEKYKKTLYQILIRYEVLFNIGGMIEKKISYQYKIIKDDMKLEDKME